MKRIILLLVVLLMFSCGENDRKNNRDKLKVGMSNTEVLDVFGDPSIILHLVSSGPENQVWKYGQFDYPDHELYFSNDTLVKFMWKE